jgi:hypothetical protein
MRAVTRNRTELSVVRTIIAVMTFGISIPFIGVRRVRRSTTRY